MDFCEKRINVEGWHAYRYFYWPFCSKLEAMAIQVVNQACGNDIMPVVYIGPMAYPWVLTIDYVMKLSRQWATLNYLHQYIAHPYALSMRL